MRCIVLSPATDSSGSAAQVLRQTVTADRGHPIIHRMLEFTVACDAKPQRLDKVLAQLLPAHSRTRLQGWITQGHVRVNGKVAPVKRVVLPGDTLHVLPQAAPEELAFTAEPVAFTVLGDSPDWIVVDKPAGLVTHPGAGNWQGTLLNGLLHRYPELSQVARAGIVHRLDKDTSGALVVARHAVAQTHLVRQLQARAVSRHYLALVHGTVTSRGTVDQAIGRDRHLPVRMTVTHPVAPKNAVTHYVPQSYGHTPDGQTVTLVACQLETGRTHQIRVHLAHLGHALLGDTLYGGKACAGATRQMLHAHTLRFQDPVDGQTVAFSAPLPQDFLAVQNCIAWHTSMADYPN